MIRVELDQTEVRAGERFKGRAIWTAAGGKRPRKVEVVCQWRVSTTGLDRTEVVGRATEVQLDGKAEATVPFDFWIPRRGPLTYQGQLFSIVWEVVANVDLPFARDENDTKVLTVLPRVWTAQDAENPDEDEWDVEDLVGGEEE